MTVQPGHTVSIGVKCLPRCVILCWFRNLTPLTQPVALAGVRASIDGCFMHVYACCCCTTAGVLPNAPRMLKSDENLWHFKYFTIKRQNCWD